MNVVQRIPGGLLELLGAKTSGVTPNGLLPDVRTTIDVLQMLGLGLPLETVLEQGAVGEASGITIEVPTTEWWLLYALDLEFDKTATVSWANFSLRIAPALAAFRVAVAEGPKAPLPWASTAAPAVVGAVFTPPYPLVLPPGTTLWGICDLLGTDATVTVTMHARIARFS